jgi:hypothetical protein
MERPAAARGAGRARGKPDGKEETRGEGTVKRGKVSATPEESHNRTPRLWVCGGVGGVGGGRARARASLRALASPISCLCLCFHSLALSHTRLTRARARTSPQRVPRLGLVAFVPRSPPRRRVRETRGGRKHEHETRARRESRLPVFVFWWGASRSTHSDGSLQ